MKFFTECQTLDDLKRAYRAAAMKHHPDRGGSTETMQQINAEYEKAFEVLKRRQNARAAQEAEDDTVPTWKKTKTTTENAGDFIRIVSELLKLDGLEVELCGRWLWIGGDTMKHRDALKALGCRWSAQKKLWSWHFAEEGDGWHRGKKTMAQIRQKYGSTTFTKGQQPDALPA